MEKKEIASDECISNAGVQVIHNVMAKSGIKQPLNDLAEREAALAAYVIFSGHTVSETVRISGAPSSLVKWVKDAVMTHALVCIEAQRQGHYSLWRDFMGDFGAEDPQTKNDDESKGGGHD